MLLSILVFYVCFDIFVFIFRCYTELNQSGPGKMMVRPYSHKVTKRMIYLFDNHSGCFKSQGQPVTLAIGKDEYGEAMKKDATTAGDNVSLSFALCL